MKTGLLFFCFTIFSLSNAQSQPIADTVWKVSFKDQKVNLGMILADGSPLVYSDFTLYCLNPQTGEIRWQSGFNSNSNARFSYFQGTPYIEVNGQVYNPINGEKLPLGQFAQTADKRSIQVKSTYFYPQNNLILIYGNVDNTEAVSALNFLTGKTLWSTTNLFKSTDEAAPKKQGFGKLGGALIKELGNNVGQQVEDAQSAGERFLSAPIIGKGNTIILPLNTGLHAIDAETGKLNWKKEYASKKKGIITVKTADPTTLLASNKDSSIVYVGRADFIEAVDMNSGKAIWPEPKPSAGPCGFFSLTDKGLLSLPASKDAAVLQNKKISLFNAENGDLIWEISLKPGVKGYLKNGDMVVVHLQHPGDKESLNAFSLPEGKLRYKKEMMLKGSVVNMKPLKNGTLVLGDEQLFIIDQNGEYLGDQVEKSKRDKWIITADNKSVYFTYTGSDLLYKINMEDNKISRVTPKEIQFEGKENIENLEVYKNTVLISSDQNILALNNETYSNLFQKYYKAPGKTTAGKIVSGYQSLGALAASLVSATNTLFGVVYTGVAATSELGQSMAELYPDDTNQLLEGLINETAIDAKQTSVSFNEARAYAAEIKKRFKAGKKGQDYLYMLSYSPDGDLGILQVSKNDGSIASTIKLRKNDKAPDYLIDEAGKHLYYIPKVTSLDELTAVFKSELGKVICLKLQ